MGFRNQVQAENANAFHKNSSDSETGDRLQDINKEPPCRCIGPTRVKELAKFFTPTSDEGGPQPCQHQDKMKETF